MERNFKLIGKKLLASILIIMLISIYVPMEAIYVYANEEKMITNESVQNIITNTVSSNAVKDNIENNIHSSTAVDNITNIVPDNTVTGDTVEADNTVSTNTVVENTVSSNTNTLPGNTVNSNVTNAVTNNTISTNITNTISTNTVSTNITNTINENTVSANIVNTNTVNENIEKTDNQLENRNNSINLADFMTVAEIRDGDGNPIPDGTAIDLSKSYTVFLRFEENGDKQFGVNAQGEMYYQLPNNIKLISNIIGKEIISEKTGIKLGTYSISMDGLMIIKWNKVFLTGEPTEDGKYYVETTPGAFLNVNFSAQISKSEDGTGETIDFGNGVIINVEFLNTHKIIVNKSALPGKDGSKFNKEDHSITYKVDVITEGVLENINLKDTMDSKLELDLNTPMQIIYQYSDGTSRTVTLNLKNYPLSIDVTDSAEGLTTTFFGTDIFRYIEYNTQTNDFILKYSDYGKTTIENQTTISVTYKTILKEDYDQSQGNGTINFDLKNTSIATGRPEEGGEPVTGSDTETVNLREIVLKKSSYTISEEDKNKYGLSSNVLGWTIEIGNGIININNTSIEDVLGEGIELALNGPCIIEFQYKDTDGNLKSEYLDANGNLHNNYVETTLAESALNRKPDNKGFNFTVPNTGKEYVKCVIKYATYFDTHITVGLEYYKNTVHGIGPIGDHTVIGNATTYAVLPEITKSVTPVGIHDDHISYKMEINIPKLYYGKQLHITDRMEVVFEVNDGGQKREVKYDVNISDVLDYIKNSFNISAKTISGKEINFENLEVNAFAEQSYYLSGENQNLFIGFNGDSKQNVKWKIDEDCLVTITYDVPLNAKLYDQETKEYTGVLADFAGHKITNYAGVVANNEINNYTTVCQDNVTTIIPQVINKKAEFVQNTNLAKFDIEVNTEKEDLDPNSDTVVIVDEMSSSLSLIESTLKAYEFNEQTNSFDIELNLETEYEETDSGSILKLTIPDETHIKILYSALMKGSGIEEVSNIAKISGIMTGTSKIEYEFQIQNSSASSGGYANGAEFYVYKIDDERKPISGINFIILDANKNTIGSQVTGIDGKFRLYDYGPGTYYLREVATSATEDYRLLQDDIKIEIDENLQITSSFSIDGYINQITDENMHIVIEVLNEDNPDIKISGRKIWKNDDKVSLLTRPNEITIELYANGIKINETKSDAISLWTYTFDGLPKYDKQGKEIDYDVKEVTVPGYISSNDNSNELNIINSLITIDVSGRKIWQDNNLFIRPDSITVVLYADGMKIASKNVSAENNWKYSFEDLPKYILDEQEEDGIREVVYTVKEILPKVYKSYYKTSYEKTNKGWNIINKLVELPPSGPSGGGTAQETTQIIDNTPKTGAQNNIVLFICTAVSSAVGILVIKNKKEKEDKQEL